MPEELNSRRNDLLLLLQDHLIKPNAIEAIVARISAGQNWLQLFGPHIKLIKAC